MPIPIEERADKIREEHEFLKGEMGKLNYMICETVTPENFPKWRLDLLWLLRDFLNHLQKHFDLEEDGGFMSDILDVAPHKQHAVEKLATEHEEMVKSFSGIIASLKSLQEKDDDRIADICERIQVAVEMLKAHESAEGELIESTYLQDEGAGD